MSALTQELMAWSPFAREARDAGAAPESAERGVSGEDVARLRDDLVRAVARTCPPWLADRADDLVQTALMRVLDVQARREGRAEFSPFYLRKAAYSAVVDEIRRLRRRREVPLDQDVEPALVTTAADPERQTAAHQLGDAVRGCLARLVPARRRAVTLHLLGHSVPEVAELLALRAKQAENLVYRGLADLRHCLQARGIGR